MTGHPPGTRDTAMARRLRAATMLRAAGALVVGVGVTVVLAYAATVAFVLASIGIPLGSQPSPLTTVQYAVLLALGGAAAAAGGAAAARISRERRGAVVALVSLTLATGMLWAFSGQNAWPDWWGPATAAAMGAGACAGGLLQRRAPHARPR
jgi:hypothetical protein